MKQKFVKITDLIPRLFFCPICVFLWSPAVQAFIHANVFICLSGIILVNFVNV